MEEYAFLVIALLIMFAPRFHPPNRRYVDVSLPYLPEQDKQFSLVDFGSAGGTFVRLATGVPTPLYPGLMIMLGKHQVLFNFN